jgi:hypothetical protein
MDNHASVRTYQHSGRLAQETLRSCSTDGRWTGCPGAPECERGARPGTLEAPRRPCCSSCWAVGPGVRASAAGTDSSVDRRRSAVGSSTLRSHTRPGGRAGRMSAPARSTQWTLPGRGLAVTRLCGTRRHSVRPLSRPAGEPARGAHDGGRPAVQQRLGAAGRSARTLGVGLSMPTASGRALSRPGAGEVGVGRRSWSSRRG